MVPASSISQSKEAGAPELAKVVKDVTRWRYGQHAHLESSLVALKLWDQANPPQLLEVEELDTEMGYGIRLRFKTAGVVISRWQDQQDRLGRFFTKGMQAEINSPEKGHIDLMILPKRNEIQPTSQHEES